MGGVHQVISDRIYPAQYPQGATLPVIVYANAGKERHKNLNGFNGLEVTRIQLECIGATYTSAKQLGDLVLADLDDFTGTVGTLNVRRIAYISDTDVPYLSANENDTFSCRQDYYITIKR